MTTGVPIYLVSACTTGEEFVAAFRRYADRGSIFIPIAEPIPSGRRGRFALALSTGVVMIEGDGEIISSSKSPSVLHGRIGMTIRFGELDDDSKTVLIELEKARLVAKPAAPSIPPRTADIPASPRAKPPAPSVRVDAGATLAESVAIGDLDSLASTTPAKPAAPKFVMPAVLPVGAPRPKTPSVAPAPQPKPVAPAGERPKTPSIPPAMPPLAKPKSEKSGGMAPLPPPKPTTPEAPAKPAPPKPEVGAFSMTMPAVDVADLKPPERVPLDAALAAAGAEIAAPRTTQMEAPPTVQMPVPHQAQIMQAVNVTPTGMNAVTPNTTPLGMAVAKPSPSAELTAVATPNTTPTELAAVPPPPGTETAKPAVVISETPTEFSAVPPPPPATPARDDKTSPTPIRAAAVARRESPTPPAGVPAKKTPTPPSFKALTPAPPIVASKPPPKLLLADADDEATDLTSVPIEGMEVAPPPADDEPSAPIAKPPTPPVATPVAKPGRDRRTVIGVAVTPLGVQVLPAAVAAKPAEAAPPDDVPVEVEEEVVPQIEAEPLLERAKLPTVEEPTPSGDWTMTPGADGPTIAPRKPTADPTPDADAKPVVPKRLTGDWTIQLDSDSPDGWSEPSKPDIARPQLPPVVKIEKARPKQAENPPELAARSASIIVDSVKEAEVAAARAESVNEEPKIQIDPTLMDAPIVTPDPPRAFAAPPPAFQAAHGRIATPIPGSLPPPGLDSMIPTGQMPVAAPIDMPVPTPPPYGRATPSPAELAAMVAPGVPAQQRMLTDGGVGFFRESGEIANLAGGSYSTGDSTSLLEVQRRRRIIVIAVSAGVVLAIGIVAVIALAGGGGGGTKKSDEPTAIPPPPVDAGAKQIATPADARAEVAPPPIIDAAVVAPEKQECFADVTTTPPGADIVLGKNVIGTSPAKVTLPCGEEAKLTIRKLRFANVVRVVTPTEEGAELKVALQKLMFSIKLSSQPAGASVSLNGAQVAVTPSTMRLPAFEVATLVFTKDGFREETSRVTPKQNNQAVHVQLKRKR